MCVLGEQGLDEWIQRLSNKPVVECRFCGARANSLRNVCAARLTEAAPGAVFECEDVALDGVDNPHAGQSCKGIPASIFGAGRVYNRHR